MDFDFDCPDEAVDAQPNTRDFDSVATVASKMYTESFLLDNSVPFVLAEMLVVQFPTTASHLSIERLR